ncbi:MAG: hypothetical protein K2O20_02650 [Duncaniella sp.]|nr:hypothetical protein [Duncaniella sp.]
MDKKDNLINHLKQLTEAQLGHGCHTPGDFDKLIIRIEKKTGEKISQSTLKRLWGYVAYPHSPSSNVLSILARFNGFSDWSSFCKTSAGHVENPVAESDSDFLTPDATATAAMNIGDRVRIEWGRVKSCTIEKIGTETFIVVSSTNIKLRAGDIVISPLFSLGKPFYAASICRDGHSAGAYVSAREKGIDSIIRITTGED